MKIALVTMNVQAGKCQENVQFMKQQIQRAREDGAEMVVFPQNAISGYLLGNVWLDEDFCQYADSFNEELIAESHDIAIVWGNIRYRNHRRFNAAFFAYQGKTHMRIKRNEAHPYQNDTLYFEENAINSAISYGEDMVFALNFGNEIQLSDMNINLDAHPYDMGKVDQLKGNVIYVNACGMQNNNHSVMLMEGGSYVMRDGKCRYQAPYFQEAYALVDLNDEQEDTIKQREVLPALTMGIQEFDRQVLGGKAPWIVGLSGGLDSSVTAALLVHALGKERVYGFNLATRHNRDITKSNARTEAEALGISCCEGSIEHLVQATHKTLKQEYDFDVTTYDTLVSENIQARARGFLLNSFAGMLGGVVVNNANKVEVALGYCTLYGDSIGALSLIGDLTKVQLFDLSRELNTAFGKEVIPCALLPQVQENDIQWVMPPSAELKEEQLDPMKWFYHDYLVEHLGVDLTLRELLHGYETHTLHNELQRWIRYYGLEEPKAFLNDLEWFLSTQERNAFKRLQLPPVLCLHHASFANADLTQMRKDQTVLATFRKNHSI